MLPSKLQPGDRVRFVSPASTPTREAVESGQRTLEDMGFRVELGKHVLDAWGYLAGRDEDRLADMNAALRDPGVKAIFSTRGGKGAYRIASGLDFDAARANPKPFVGFSEGTIIHLALYKHTGLAGIHGAPWKMEQDNGSLESFRHALLSSEPVLIHSRKTELTHTLTIGGKAEGILLGGNQDMIATAAGWALPSLDGAILLLEAVGMQLGHIDRQLTMLHESGALRGIRGIAIGQYTDCGPAANDSPHDWIILDVLRDRLGRLNVPILGGLPIGHGDNPRALPIGTRAILDADNGTLTVEAGVR